MMIEKMRPRTQARIVLTGMSGPSVLPTADRTSEKGESSSAEGVKNLEFEQGNPPTGNSVILIK